MHAMIQLRVRDVLDGINFELNLANSFYHGTTIDSVPPENHSSDDTEPNC